MSWLIYQILRLIVRVWLLANNHFEITTFQQKPCDYCSLKKINKLQLYIAMSGLGQIYAWVTSRFWCMGIMLTFYI